MRTIEVAERRARLSRRHHLAADTRAGGPVEAARGVVALHGTDPASVYLAIWGRCPQVEPKTIEQALYDDRTLVRMLGMRRTVFVVPTELAPVVEESSTRAIAVTERRKLLRLLDEAGYADPAGWLAAVEAETLAALAVRGEAAGAELSKDVPGLREQVTMARGKKYEATVNLTSRVLFVLAAEGRIVRGRPRGSWISNQFRWSHPEVWLRDPPAAWSVDAARVELVRRWLAAFGPGTAADLRWWTGWTMAEVRRALSQLDVVEVDLAGVTGLVLASDVEPVPAAEPAVTLLPALDPTPMGWQGRGWFLGEYGPALFDRSGNIGPTIWYDGRIVGGWAQRPDGTVVHRLLEDLGTGPAADAQDACDRLTDWLGAIRVTPRFRTPLERELVS